MRDIDGIEKVVFGFTISVVFVIALVANFLVIFVVRRNTFLRSQFSSVFIVNLAICDFITALLCMPVSLVALLYSGWSVPTALCHFNGFSNQFLGVSAILTLAVISVDRLYAVVKPLKYRANMTMRKAFFAVLYVWLQATTFAVVPILTGWYVFNENYLFCTFNPASWKQTEVAFTSCLYLINFGLPLLIMLSAYYKIFKIARLHSKRIAPALVTLGTFGIQNLMNIRKEIGREREAKTARKIILVVVAFLCCDAPYTVIRLSELAKGKNLQLPVILTISCKWLNFLKSSLNPLIYGLFQRRFRSGLSAIFLSKCQKKRSTHFFHRDLAGREHRGIENNNTKVQDSSAATTARKFSS